MSKRIAYQPIRSIIGFLTPMFLLIALPHWLGITSPKPEYETLIHILSYAISFMYAQTIVWAIYALIHNARLETNDANSTN